MANGTRMIVQDTEEFKSDGHRLSNFSEDYLLAVTRIYQIVDELNSSSWKGIKATNYIEKIKVYEQPLKDLSTLMSDMANGISNAVNALEQFESAEI